MYIFQYVFFKVWNNTSVNTFNVILLCKFSLKIKRKKEFLFILMCSMYLPKLIGGA